jgi:hypothetical protein
MEIVITPDTTAAGPALFQADAEVTAHDENKTSIG